MKTVVQQAADLIGQAKARELARRRAAGERLRAILLRNESPMEGDEDALVGLMGELGVKPDDLPGLLELVRTLDQQEGLLAREDEFTAQHRTALSEIEAIDTAAQREHDRIDRETAARKEPIRHKQNQAQGMLSRVREARQWVNESRAKWMALIDQISLDDARRALNGPRGLPHGAIGGCTALGAGR